MPWCYFMQTQFHGFVIECVQFLLEEKEFEKKGVFYDQVLKLQLYM